MGREAVSNGAESDRDPDYAYPALMESVFMTFPHDIQLAYRMYLQMINWCKELGIANA